MGDAAVRGAGSLWRKLVPTLREQPDAKRAIEDLSRDPDLNSAQAVLGGRIAFVLDADGDLLREAAAVVDARDRYVASNIKVRGNQNAVALGNDNIVIASSRDVRIRGGGRGSPGAR